MEMLTGTPTRGFSDASDMMSWVAWPGPPGKRGGSVDGGIRRDFALRRGYWMAFLSYSEVSKAKTCGSSGTFTCGSTSATRVPTPC